MDSLLTWAASLPILPRALLSLLVVGAAAFVLLVLWTPRQGVGEGSRQPDSAGAIDKAAEPPAVDAKREEAALDTEKARGAIRPAGVGKRDEPPSIGSREA